MTRIRVICSDPYATDYSSDEETLQSGEKKSPKRIVYNIELNRNPAPTRTPKSPYKCVYWKKKAKKWTSEFRDPFTHTRFYLGSFETAEAAHEAYCNKKREHEEKAASRKRRKFDCLSDEDLEPKKKIYETRKPAEPIRNPVRATRSKVSACCGGNSSPKKRAGKIGPVRKTNDRREIEEKEAYNNEEQLIEFSCSISREMASLIIDEDGYLMGEFSQIDDLTVSVGNE